MEFHKMLQMFVSMQPENVIEVGSFYGGTLWFWTHFSDALVSLASIDCPIGPDDGRYEDMLHCRAMWPKWTEGIDFHDIQGDSHDFHTIQRVKLLYPDNDVDFLFIDGDHSYEGVKADYENYQSLVRPGGLIVFHDVCGLPEVKLFWDEIKPNHKTIEIHEPNGWGIGIIEV